MHWGEKRLPIICIVVQKPKARNDASSLQPNQVSIRLYCQSCQEKRCYSITTQELESARGIVTTHKKKKIDAYLYVSNGLILFDMDPVNSLARRGFGARRRTRDRRMG